MVMELKKKDILIIDGDRVYSNVGIKMVENQQRYIKIVRKLRNHGGLSFLINLNGITNKFSIEKYYINTSKSKQTIAI